MKKEKMNREDFGKIGQNIFHSLYDLLEDTKEYCRKERAKIKEEMRREKKS
jgi:hypothetical protein